MTDNETTTSFYKPTDEDYQRFKDLLKFFYAQYRYNIAAGTTGGVSKLGEKPRPKDPNQYYDLRGHLERFHVEALLDANLVIGTLPFSVKVNDQGSSGSAKCTYVSLRFTPYGLYLNDKVHHLRAGYKVGPTDLPFDEFFTWDESGQDPEFLWMGEQGSPKRFKRYRFDELGLSDETPNDQLKEMFDRLLELKHLTEERDAQAAQEAATGSGTGTSEADTSQQAAVSPQDAIADKDVVAVAKKAPELHHPRNWILYGAPGTGKSNRIDSILGNLKRDGVAVAERRVTFHPDYTYAQFVGSYRPVRDPDQGIAYDFVPGPFTNALVSALSDPSMAQVLVIEEINRADPAGVFGDVFQLLDRNSKDGDHGPQGQSVYPIETSTELAEYLAQQLDGSEDEYRQLSIPANLYVWATMNSADQGVFPMDTAFKRRWSFEYLPLDADRDPAKMTQLEKRWDVMRRGINDLLERKVRDIPEDKLLGSWFLSGSDLEDETAFREALVNKVVMYLFDDAARYARPAVFRTGPAGNGTVRMSALARNIDLDKADLGIFAEELPVRDSDRSAGANVPGNAQEPIDHE